MYVITPSAVSLDTENAKYGTSDRMTSGVVLDRLLALNEDLNTISSQLFHYLEVSLSTSWRGKMFLCCSALTSSTYQACFIKDQPTYLQHSTQPQVLHTYQSFNYTVALPRWFHCSRSCCLSGCSLDS